MKSITRLNKTKITTARLRDQSTTQSNHRERPRILSYNVTSVVTTFNTKAYGNFR